MVKAGVILSFHFWKQMNAITFCGKTAHKEIPILHSLKSNKIRFLKRIKHKIKQSFYYSKGELLMFNRWRFIGLSSCTPPQRKLDRLYVWKTDFEKNNPAISLAYYLKLCKKKKTEKKSWKLSTGLADASLDLTCHLAKTWSNLSPIASFFKKKIYISISKKINNLLNIQNKLESCLKFTYVDYHTRICHECKKTRNGIAMFFP